jgi:hypothetical protein
MPYLRRARLVRQLNFMRLVLLLSLPAALINGITGFEGPVPLLFFVAPVTALLISFLLPAPEPVKRLDRACCAEGEIITWTEFAGEPQKGPYGEILTARVNRRLEKNSPVKVFPLPRFFISSLFILALLLSFSLLFPGFFTARRNLIQDKLDQLDRRFAEAAENDPRFTPLAEKFKEMEKEYFPQKESSPGNKDWEELSKDLTEQIRELERNRLSELFEDQGEKKAQGLAELSRGEMEPGEIRNFILELMSDPGLDGDVSDSLARSYRDYSEDSGEEQQRQKELARNLMDQVDPENRENRRELHNLAEELGALAEGPGPEEESSGEGEEFREERESRQIGGSSGTEGPSRAEETGEATTAAGSRADPGDTAGSDFNPHQGERPEVQLPEGPVLERGDRGIIRLEGEEKIKLERTSSAEETGAPLLEEATGQEEIPPRFRDLVRDYFITIGTGTP